MNLFCVTFVNIILLALSIFQKLRNMQTHFVKIMKLFIHDLIFVIISVR